MGPRVLPKEAGSEVRGGAWLSPQRGEQCGEGWGLAFSPGRRAVSGGAEPGILPSKADSEVKGKAWFLP